MRPDTPAVLLELHQRHAAAWGLDPIRPGAWHDDPPSDKQIAALAKAAARLRPGALTADEIGRIREVAADPYTAGKGAVAAACGLAFNAGRVNTGASPSGAPAARGGPPGAGPVRDMGQHEANRWPAPGGPPASSGDDPARLLADLVRAAAGASPEALARALDALRAAA